MAHVQIPKACRVVLSFLLSVVLCFGLSILVEYQDWLDRVPTAAEVINSILEYDPSRDYTLPETTTEETTEGWTYEMQIDMEKVSYYHSLNEDVIGWIYIQDTVINYPIMQDDDNSYYIEHNWQKQYSHSGSIFADYKCRIDAGANLLIYGHNMASGAMFHAIKNYKVQSWGEEHLYFEVASLEKRYLYRVISCNVIYGESGASFPYWRYCDMDRETYAWYLDCVESSSLCWYAEEDEEFLYGKDRLVTLQTCNSASNDGMRCVVFAVLEGIY